MSRIGKLLSLPFFILLTISAILWFVSKLSHQYTTQVELPIKIVADYNSQMWIDNGSKRVRAVVTSSGRELLLCKMGLSEKLVIPLSMLKLEPIKQGADLYRYQINDQSFEKAIMQVQNSFKINIIVDTIQTVRVSLVQTKRVPLIANIAVDCKDGYIIDYKGIKLSVDSIDVKAPWAILDTLRGIVTERVDLDEVMGRVSGGVRLDVPHYVIVDDKVSVRYEVRTVAYSEKTFEVPIQVRGNLQARSLPSKAVVYLRVPIEIYQRVSVPVVSIDPVVSSRSGFYPLVVSGLDVGVVVGRVEPLMARFYVEHPSRF